MSRRGEKIEREKKEKQKLHDLACEYYRQHEVEHVSLSEIYLNAKKPFQVHKATKKSADAHSRDWYNKQVLPLLTPMDMLNAFNLGFSRVLQGIDEGLNSNTYTRDGEGKLMGVPDNRIRHESTKFLYAVQRDMKESMEGGEGTGANKITIEITGSQLQTARDVWNDIQD